jgi:excisionase family DNA binding protein
MQEQQTSVSRLTLSIRESAYALGISQRGLYNLIDGGKLKTIRLGRRRLVPREELERLCRPQEAAA